MNNPLLHEPTQPSLSLTLPKPRTAKGATSPGTHHKAKIHQPISFA